MAEIPSPEAAPVAAPVTPTAMPAPPTAMPALPIAAPMQLQPTLSAAKKKKYIKYGIAAGLALLVLLIIVIIIVVIYRKRCTNDFDCKFGQTCQSGWCK